MKYNTLLCFDYGTKRIGTAIGQSLTGTATPLDIVHCHKNRPDWKQIEQLLEEWKPDAIIVGIPVTMDGSPQVMTRAAEKFASQLEGRFRLPVFGVDERLSTYEAKTRTGEQREVDSVAAQAILETWLTGKK